MQIQLSSSSRSKLEQILDRLYTRFDLEELKPDELADALIGIGYDLIVADETSMPNARERLIEYCAAKVGMRLEYDTPSLEEGEYRG